jgi:predicted phage terminase large subunit-like protein
LRHKENSEFGAVVFRRSIAEIIKEGGLWDEAGKLYPLLDGKPNENEHQYTFGEGSRVTFGHLQYDDTVNDWKSAQIPLMEFDQLETFTEHQFFYMLSRNRSTCGVRPYVRASANPEPGWLADFLAWWIGEDGYAIAEHSGVIRWMIRQNDTTYWGDTCDEVYQAHKIKDLPDDDPSQPRPKSVTFILSTVYDNQILLKLDPGYLANLQALPYVDRERLLGDAERGGNWKIKPSAGKIFNRAWFEIVDAVPAGGHEVRFWDLAATEKKTADSTASCKGKIVRGIVYILDATNEKIDPARTDITIKNTAIQDGKNVTIRFEQEGGASGKRDSYHLVTMLAGYDVRGEPPQGDKIMRAKPLSAQALAGNVKLLRGSWNERWLNQMHGQPDLAHDDDMDAASGMYNELSGGGRTSINATANVNNYVQ